MNNQKTVTLCFLITALYSTTALAIDVTKAAELINNMSETICGKMLYDSNTKQATLSGEATAKINSLLKNIADIGGTVKVNTTTTGYYGVNQSDLPETLKSSQACRTHIFDSLSGLLTNQPVTLPLTPVSAVEAPKVDSTTTVIVDGNHTQTATGTKDTKMCQGQCNGQ